MSLFENLQHRRGRVLFLSGTNFCRGQMAEAFARALGADSIVAFSAGLHAAAAVSAAARTVMAEKGVPMFPDQHPRPVTDFDPDSFDAIVNWSGARHPIPAHSALVLEPLVPAPLADDLESHRAVRDRIETIVVFLAEHFRRAKEWTPDAQGELRRDTPKELAGTTEPGAAGPGSSPSRLEGSPGPVPARSPKSAAQTIPVPPPATPQPPDAPLQTAF